MASSSASAETEKETLQWCEKMFREVSKELHRLGQSEGEDIFVRLADISKALSDGVSYAQYPAEEVDNLNNRAFYLLVQIQNPFPVYNEALREFYEFFDSRWHDEYVDQMIDEGMEWTWKS
jgi:hypothetical protein